MTDLYDYHEHHDTRGRTTGYAHIHDRHPYHHHDLGGSVHYIDPDPAVTPITLERPADPIGCGGYDITRRIHPQ